MKEQLISFKTARLLRKHGVDWKCEQAYMRRFHEHDAEGYEAPLTNKPLHCDIPAPTQSLVQKWLREKHKIDIIVEPYNGNFRGTVPKGNIQISACQTYEEALEYCLETALSLIDIP